MREVFAELFLSRWLFDVELLARLISQDAAAADRIHEFPLAAWQDVAGSKVKAFDFVRAAWQLAGIWSKYPELRQPRDIPSTPAPVKPKEQRPAFVEPTP